MKKYLLIGLVIILCGGFAPKANAGAAFYIDFKSGLDTNAGTATTTAWQTLDKCMANTRSAGDTCFVRNGVSSTTNPTNVSVTSSGTAIGPITVTADHDNLWNDFASSSQTATLTVGSKTITMSASTTVIVASSTIYVAGDCAETYNSVVRNTCNQYYAVKSVTNTIVQLWFPYNGPNSGSGKTLRIMPPVPQWHRTDQAFNVTWSDKTNWILDGISFNGAKTGSVGVLTPTFSSTNSSSNAFFNLLIEGGAASGGWPVQWGGGAGYFEKSVLHQNPGSTSSFVWNGAADVVFKNDILEYGGSGTTNTLLNAWNTAPFYGDGVEFDPGSGATAALFSTNGAGPITCRNCYLDRGVWTSVETTLQYNIKTSSIKLENAQQSTTSQAVWYPRSNDSTTNTVFYSTSTPTLVRSGGGPNSIGIHPTTVLASSSPIKMIQLFEYPIYTNTTSKSYTVYFMSTSTAAWTLNPSAAELWIECEYLGATTASSTTITKRSTGTLNLTGSTAWQSLAVTCVPAQAGILYLRGWYGKTKEATGVQNELYVDTTPVIQ